MSGSNRGKRTPLVEWVFPFIGIVLALSLALGVGALIGSSPANPPTKEQQQQYTAAKARYAKAGAGTLTDPDTNYAAYPDKNAYECYYAKQHDSADLCAQWRAAIAAENSARWTFWAFAISFAGTALSGVALIGLLLSLQQTERSLKEAKDGNDLARQTAKRQLRPYIYPSHAGFKLVAGKPIITMSIKNFGQTPALNKRGWIHTWVECYPLHDPLPEPPTTFRMSSSVVGPGADSEWEQPHGARLNDYSITEIEAGRAALYVYGIERYTDAFGDDHVTRYIFFANGKGSLERGRLKPYTSGNYMDV